MWGCRRMYTLRLCLCLCLNRDCDCLFSIVYLWLWGAIIERALVRAQTTLVRGTEDATMESVKVQDLRSRSYIIEYTRSALV